MTHPLSRELQKMFSSTVSVHDTDVLLPKHHYQVYTDAAGSRYRHAPAYVGTDRAEADMVAAKIGGTVHVVDGAP